MAVTPTPAPPVAIPPVVSYLIAAVIAIAGLLLGQGLIDNRTEKLVEGLASVGIPMVFVLANTLIHLATARVTAARITAPITVAVAPRAIDYTEKPKP